MQQAGDRIPVFGCTPVFPVFRGSRWSGMALGIYPAGMDLFANLPPGQSDAVAGNGPGLVTILQEIRRKSHDSEGLHLEKMPLFGVHLGPR